MTKRKRKVIVIDSLTSMSEAMYRDTMYKAFKRIVKRLKRRRKK